MTVIFFLIPLSIVIAAGFLAAFIWAVRNGQFEDTETPSMRLLAEDLTEQRKPQISIKPEDQPNQRNQPTL